ncbi:hypothetical protein [Deinococcus soli (ex Cha et al. 2016)]|uniref:Uncharacterized protein n=2 Tax=Deinococcus soli (ex Cha et al. 2016) TaxID=1309411 RepID=A0AAE3XBC3_9DEIO|nr:hypothetical protein [Deinococcus soli (ex Cha et al. 2016)]MDR6218126.1 hypothetical protein [Deinococcus soli (ex Cha et al. 2016)]MDR6328866.1 hypothetical protein [Deinococcus soli (ex Cha et al. 2016)]MDR6751646.1 hypothetical protein [Deinococcus soli (ex Cha et al. 2016)]
MQTEPQYGQRVDWTTVTVGDVIGNVETEEAGQILAAQGHMAQVAVIDPTLLGVIGVAVTDPSDTRWWALTDAFYVTSSQAFSRLQQRQDAALTG